ncbi:O100 family O-antigen flippase, partial [Escherichia coli]|nr:O100 family O-antigen flippase [Escherichia coli]
MEMIKSTLMRNILFLGLIQGSSFLLPLILLPFLIKTLGTETYGKMILYQVFFLYLSTIIDFGYNFSATQNIARNQNDSYHIK